MKIKAKTKSPTHCAACGHLPTALNKLVKLKSGSYIHASHIKDPNSGFYNAK